MHILTQKKKVPQQSVSTMSTVSGRAHFGQSREASSILHLQRTMGNQAVQRLLAHVGNVKGVTTTTPAEYDVQATDTGHIAQDPVPIAHDFGTLQILPIQAPHVDLPGSGEPEEIVDQPPGTDVTDAPASTSESCGQPRSMNKLTSGSFLGGLTMDSYYPHLAGGSYYSHPGTGGTFDTGSRAGANVQLYGVIPSPCLPRQYTFEQTVTRSRYRINGTVHPEEGRTFDDIAKSGGDYTRPPRRQEFLGGDSAPLGYIISMADPPSTGYNSTSNIEHDRDFVTTLVGPSGRQSVRWSVSTRISGGTVTSNVVT
jgi:hypothetical protein